MRRIRWQFKAAGLVAALAAVFPCQEPLQAQVDGWVIGNQAVVMPPGTGSDAGDPFTLPQPNDPAIPAAFRYQGQVAARSQHVRTTGDERILFFAVDGKLYDGDGYLIADARGPGCTECLDPGIMEFVSVPVPGQCGIFYLLSGVAKDVTSNFYGTHVQWSILDMNADNPRFPADAPTTCARKGRLLSLDEIGQAPYANFNGWAVQYENGTGVQPTSDHMGALPSTSASTSPRFRVVESANANGDHWLFSIIDNRVYVDRLTANGIFRVQPTPGQSSLLIASNTNNGNQPYYYDADAIRTTLPNRTDDVLALAIADGYRMFPFPATSNGVNNLLVHYFDRNTGAWLQGDSKAYQVNAPPIGCGGVTVDLPDGGFIATSLRGCAFRSDGNGLYLTGERTTDCQTAEPYVVHLDLNSDVYTDLGYAFGSAIDPEWVRTRIYRNAAVNGSGAGVYFPALGQVGVLQGLENLSTCTFTAGALGTVAPPLLFNGLRPVDCGFVPRFLDIGVANDRYLSATNRQNCCTFLQSRGSGMVYGHRQAPGMTPTSWSGTNNPYSNTAPLTCVCDLVLEEGAQLYLNNMELRFAPDAKIIVERGARLHKNNTWTTSLSCPEERWPGIRVEGTTSNGDQAGSAQGHLRINGGGVRNAVVGAWTAREISNTGNVDVGYFGGMIRATSNAVFQDCITGVRIERYQRISDGVVLPNLSLFSSCEFVTTADWPGGSPLHHANLFLVQGIRFTQCKFRNDDPGQFPLLGRGYGIFGVFAGFDVEGSTTPSASLFQDLTIGVAAATGTLRRANIRRTWFQDNHIGAYLQACNAPEVSRSHFNVPALTIAPFSPMGLVLHHSTGYLVEENNFHGGDAGNGNIGIYWRGDVLTENRIYNNAFHDLNVGTYVTDRQKGGINTETEYLGLQLLCSDYTACGFDYYLGDNTYIKAAQGFFVNAGDPQNQLAGNRFYSGAISGISISSIQPQGLNAPFFNYLRHNVPDCNPQNTEFFPSAYYSDLPVGPTSFNKTEDCSKGSLPAIGGGGGIIGFGLAAAQLKSAQAYFTGTVDTGEREDIMVAIKQDDPWLGSHTLRDYLLARCPLSDEVLLAAIYRPEPMDPWHLTQVMLANARLTDRVKRALETSGLLNEYMLAIVLNAGSGPTVKDLLRQEVELRAAEKAQWLTVAVDEIASDSLLAHPQQVLYTMLAAHPDPSDHYWLAGIALEQGDHSTATAWLDSLVAARAEDPWLLRELVDMHQQLGGDWTLADAGQRAQLAGMANNAEPGAAMAWSILYHLGETDEVPTAEMPDGSKSLNLQPAKAPRAAERPLIEAHPNPTSGQSWIVIGVEVDDAAFVRISDPQGRLVRTHRLARAQRLLEVDLSGLANGLYTCELVQGEYKLGVTKLAVQR